MKLLEERIRKDGVVKPGNVLKVDSFINHQMDILFMEKLAEEYQCSAEQVAAQVYETSERLFFK